MREDATGQAHGLDAELQKLRVAFAALQAEFRKLQAENQELRAANRQLQAENAALRDALAKAQRAGKRQAAPFSKNKPKEKPQKPGRKSGPAHGRHGHRPPPEATALDENLEAPLPSCCPHCGGHEFTDLDSVEQFQEELPRQPLRRRFTIHRGKCVRCGQRVQGRHPLQTSDASGACASQLGPDAQAAVVYLNKNAGMSYGKISAAFQSLHGINISRGGCAQIVLRAAAKLEPALVEIHDKIRASAHVTPDESGWREGGRPVWLHAWVGDEGASAYAIDPQRSADALQRLLGLDWSGNMTHDGASTYDRFAEACHQQCVDHACRRARSLLEKHPDRPVFPQRILDILTGALGVRDRHLAGQLDQAELERWQEEYTVQLLQATARPPRLEEYRAFAQHLYNHGEQWFLFLVDPTIPATNHRAEQALKTPIVNRKVFGGNQTPAGARAQETTSSVLQTCKNRAIDFVSYVSDALCGCVASLFR